jgi:hypothetical protein
MLDQHVKVCKVMLMILSNDYLTDLTESSAKVKAKKGGDPSWCYEEIKYAVKYKKVQQTYKTYQRCTGILSK